MVSKQSHLNLYTAIGNFGEVYPNESASTFVQAILSVFKAFARCVSISFQQTIRGWTVFFFFYSLFF